MEVKSLTYIHLVTVYKQLSLKTVLDETPQVVFRKSDVYC